MPVESLVLKRHHKKQLDQLKRGHEVILGKLRKAWVADAAKAFISATTPSGRWLMLRDGFFHFQRVAPGTIAEMSGFKFTSEEIRFIWFYLAEYVHVYERHLGPIIQAEHERERTHSKEGEPVEPPPPTHNDPREIVTETLPDHEKRRLN